MSARFIASIVLAAGVLLVPAEGFAQPQRPGSKKGLALRGDPKNTPMLDRLRRMTPEQRRRFLRNLPPERRRLIEQRLREVDRMSPEERSLAARRLEDFQSLPEERRMWVRRLHGVFLNMPRDRRELLRQEVQTLDDLSPEDRKTRMESEEFRNSYSPAEQRWLFELNRALRNEQD
jgi:hypothetical protein